MAIWAFVLKFELKPLISNYKRTIIHIDISSWDLKDKYSQICKFYTDVSLADHAGDIEIIINNFFDAHYSAAIAAILNKFFKYDNKVTFKAPQSNSILTRNGLLSFFQNCDECIDTNNTAIPLRKIKVEFADEFIDYLNLEYFSKIKQPAFSDGAMSRIIENFHELLLNVNDHSQSDSLYISGQFFPNRNVISLLFVDIGLGIPYTVNSYLRQMGENEVSSCEAINWALKQGNSTKNDIARGLGLHQVFQLVKLNGGHIEIISDTGLFIYSGGKINQVELSHSFGGTMVCITLKTDDKTKYFMANEVT